MDVEGAFFVRGGCGVGGGVLRRAIFEGGRSCRYCGGGL